ncbi:SepM family pheromone-processing serine protease [Metabacillus niabensis]|uniref:endopeptidase La n=1 Tax=Metabacillus niabensis TaxID=324854 RepID=A0ABT9Z6Z6_9BACI|nr:SepM family pheromone-processing serine protease [Metabacillus niabensis]MDQ0227060.1 PDZ domain-containing protein [Metabacillus niabensis]
MKRNIVFRSILLCSLIIIAVTFIKLPYYVTKPGMAAELEPIVEVENGYKNESGSFSLTTVQFGRANPITYMWAKFHDYYYLMPLEDFKRKDESDEDYFKRQLHLMETSQESAITTAYLKANKSVSYSFHGVYVEEIVKGMPAENKLKVGDRIYKVDQYLFQTAEEFIEYVGNKENGDKITISFERDGVKKQVEVPVAPFEEEPSKIGIGISLITDRELIVDPKIKLNTEEIGGPSAGLMMALEIYNQLNKEDISKGYKIAGTGTINPEGEVGPIGGISQKIVAADKAGMDIFFAPNEKGKNTSNYQEAIEVGKKIKTKMKIVPVDTFDDALDYLQKLKEK